MFKIACASLILGTSMFGLNVENDVSSGRFDTVAYRGHGRAAPDGGLASAFKGEPTWTCDGGEGADRTHIEFTAFEDFSITGKVKSNGLIPTIPLVAKYARQEKVMKVYTEYWRVQKHIPLSTELGRSVPEPVQVLTLTWQVDNQWTGVVENSQLKISCTDDAKAKARAR